MSKCILCGRTDSRIITFPVKRGQFVNLRNYRIVLKSMHPYKNVCQFCRGKMKRV